ncbi:protein-L-isoaspartate O-methyltransferase [Phenylobacterium sp.]|jgi:protein-L-isoaspartate(D-aspartate) O-methyltransferase|uniref:protein-L-isoaspartate O-methyltransferase family protein n=1 Tax=Phenylobacterium sp. TaxID=1871053 RepID=UPI0025D34ACF|nr:protein-L-isoaspartate O-methyltransferase [Phenylobacterium sp.]MCA6287028.1 protein-L-isoaspartate O-methyltransferase [Phenylobacterium sp.]MCA6310300.1 protein-L-isoaspartate O-methyltransferase [Phenylobacterium sp.]MCA6324653.1 protein-L-isoaspartate O-methyltransferase [Phenylobacterium sp.]MCA6336617.1 protein-L-isoaspartate O-methyltransferase [Phenylobacterium sp.]MCA6340631.1 protein-L-isoaspartate O-methyltransferase [Phenylobacterium sp.]
MDETSSARLNMVESQVRTADVTDLRIQDAMRRIPREKLLPSDRAYLAYADTEPEYAPGRRLLRPRDVAKLIQLALPADGETALAIAAPYAAMLLEACGVSVTRFDDASLARPPQGPFDLLVSEGAVARIPDSWLEVLSLGGRAVIVERQGPTGRAVVYVKTGEGVGRRTGFDSAPAFLPGLEPQTGFVF